MPWFVQHCDEDIYVLLNYALFQVNSIFNVYVQICRNIYAWILLYYNFILIHKTETYFEFHEYYLELTWWRNKLQKHKWCKIVFIFQIIQIKKLQLLSNLLKIRNKNVQSAVSRGRRWTISHVVRCSLLLLVEWREKILYLPPVHHISKVSVSFLSRPKIQWLYSGYSSSFCLVVMLALCLILARSVFS